MRGQTSSLREVFKIQYPRPPVLWRPLTRLVLSQLVMALTSIGLGIVIAGAVVVFLVCLLGLGLHLHGNLLENSEVFST